MSEDPKASQPKQKTRPKKGKPIEIPVPKRSDFNRLLKRAEKGSARRDRPSEY
jgi:hypothetical protein